MRFYYKIDITFFEAKRQTPISIGFSLLIFLVFFFFALTLYRLTGIHDQANIIKSLPDSFKDGRKPHDSKTNEGEITQQMRKIKKKNGKRKKS